MDDRYDMHDGAVIQNPFPLLAEMRRDAPVHWNRSLKGWFLTRYHDVRMVMRDPRFSVEKIAPFADQPRPSMQHKIAFLTEILGGWMVFMDPPGHTRLREVLQSAFMPRTLAELRPRVAAVASDLLDRVAARTEMELIADFAYPLPAVVIGDLCGVPRDMTGQIQAWSADIAAFVLQGRATPDKYDRTYGALRECVDYYRDLVADHPHDVLDDHGFARARRAVQHDRLVDEHPRGELQRGDPVPAGRDQHARVHRRNPGRGAFLYIAPRKIGGAVRPRARGGPRSRRSRGPRGSAAARAAGPRPPRRY